MISHTKLLEPIAQRDEQLRSQTHSMQELDASDNDFWILSGRFDELNYWAFYIEKLYTEQPWYKKLLDKFL